MWNYEPLSQIFIPKGYPFLLANYNLFTHFWYTISPKIYLNTDFLAFLVHLGLSDFVTPMVWVLVLSWENPTLYLAFCSWMTICLARVAPTSGFIWSRTQYCNNICFSIAWHSRLSRSRIWDRKYTFCFLLHSTSQFWQLNFYQKLRIWFPSYMVPVIGYSPVFIACSQPVICNCIRFT